MSNRLKHKFADFALRSLAATALIQVVACGAPDDVGAPTSFTALADEADGSVAITAPMMDAGLASIDAGTDATHPDGGSDSDAGSQDPANPGRWSIARVIANGTGCPPGSVFTSISSDGSTFTTIFSQYEAQVTPDTGVSAAKDCQFDIALKGPQNASYTISHVEFDGYVFAEAGVTATSNISYYVQGSPGASSDVERNYFQGPYDDYFITKVEVPKASQIWTPCNLQRNLELVTRAVVKRSNASSFGYENYTSVDGNRGKLIVKLQARTCPTASIRPSSAVGASGH